MSRLFQGLSWRSAIFGIAVCYLLADLYAFKGPLHGLLLAGQRQGGGAAAEVYGLSITRQELAEAIRELLWKRHETWAGLGPEARAQTRWQALEHLVDDRLLRADRSRSGLDSEAPKAAAKREGDRMQRQFADAGEFPRRLAAQHLTPKSLAAEIEAVQLDEAWIAAQIQPRLEEITQQDLRDWYDEHQEELRIPQAHHAAHIFLAQTDKTKPDRMAEIQEIQRQLLAKEKTFAQLAKEHSEDARSKTVGGDLGWFTQERMPADFIAAVKGLSIGQFSAPVRTQLGWHLIIVLERRASRLPGFAETKAEIAALLTSKRREAAVQSLLRERAQQPVIYHAEVIEQAEPAP